MLIVLLRGEYLLKHLAFVLFPCFLEEDTIYELYCDALSAVSRVRQALVVLAALERKLLVVALRLLLERGLHELLALHLRRVNEALHALTLRFPELALPYASVEAALRLALAHLVAGLTFEHGRATPASFRLPQGLALG